MKEKFRNKLNLNKKNQERLSIINTILEEYSKQGYKLTLRQLYYQLVSRDIIPNQQKEYSKLSTLLVKARMVGIIDWEAIEDRLRTPFLPYSFLSVEGAIEDTINCYRLDRQENQKNYIELWVEKDSLSGVLKPITSHFHINLVVNRGYSSCTAMHDAYERFVECEDKGKEIYILYLGDYDPSGLDMIRDIKDRLEEFGIFPKVNHIGLTIEQIKNYNPPPNPAKITDPRARGYISKFGKTSWEVDALNPKILNDLTSKNIESLIDMNLFNEQLLKEKTDKQKLNEFLK